MQNCNRRATLRRLLDAAVAAAICAFPTPAVAQTRSAANAQTLLKTNMVRGFVTVYVNGQKVGRYGKKDIIRAAPGEEPIASVNISSRVKPGKNTFRAVWNEARYPVGAVHVSYAAPGGRFRKLAEINLGVFNKEDGDKSVVFTVPGANNSAATVSTREVAADAPAGRRGGGPAGKGKVAPGSHVNQTLMTANITRGNITVFVNGKKVGSYTNGLVPLDISDYARSGANTLRVSFADNVFPIGSIRISYAAQANKFRQIAQYDMGVFTRKRANQTVTFNLP